MDNSEPDYLKWDMEDQGIGSEEFPASGDKNFDEIYVDDDVFLSRDDVCNESILNPKPKIERESGPTCPVSPRSPPCSVQWSLSHRCMNCAWKAQRGGRPQHPSPILPSGPASPPLVTLQSLSTTRDSGYEPSPTSAFSFSFTSDDDDTEVDEGSSDTLGVDEPLVATGLTPPINIPPGGAGGVRRKSRSAKTTDDYRVPAEDSSPKERAKIARGRRDISPTPPTPLRRSKSVPELWASERMLPRSPIVVGTGDFLKKPIPAHGRNYSWPATTPDGKPSLAPSPPTPASRSSREGLIDLTEEDPEGSFGHHRRVLVLALPDILVDLEPLKRDGSSLSNSSSIQSPSEKSSSSSSSTSSKDTNPSLASGACSRSYSRRSRGSNPSNSSPEAGEVINRSRPAWRRPRALSCDVTLEVEFGQELRKAADEFSKTYSTWQGGMWRALRNSFGRRVSLAGCTPMAELSPSRDSSGDRVSHSLPSSPSHPSHR